MFTPFEILAVILAVLIVNYLSADGRCNWLEGAQLISVYSDHRDRILFRYIMENCDLPFFLKGLLDVCN